MDCLVRTVHPAASLDEDTSCYESGYGDRCSSRKNQLGQLHQMTTTWTTLSVLDWTIKRFTEANIDGARLEAQVIVAHALGCTRIALYTQFDKPLGEEELAKCRGLIKQRLAGNPLAYVVGETEFWGLKVRVTADVLIPRNDTETVVEAALARFPERTAKVRVLDACTGSGVIALVLAKELPNSEVVVTDISAAALAVARENFATHGMLDRVTLHNADLWPVERGDGFDLVISNPPYIRDAVIATLDREVQREPRLALAGGEDGLDFYRRIAQTAREYLLPAGLLVLEHGYDQAEQVSSLLAHAGFVEIQTLLDLGKQPRTTLAKPGTHP